MKGGATCAQAIEDEEHFVMKCNSYEHLKTK